MCSQFILSALFFSLALGPQVMFLHAQELDEMSASTPLNDKITMATDSPAESRVTSPEKPTAKPTADPTIDFIMETNSTTAPSQLTSTLETQPVMELMAVPIEENFTTTEFYADLTTTVTQEIITTQPRVTTEPPAPQLITERPDTTVEVDVFTTKSEDPQTSSPVPTSTPRTAGSTASEATTILTSQTEETMETTHSTMAANPITILPTQDEKEDLVTGDVNDILTEGTEIYTETTTVTEDTPATVTEKTTNDIEIGETASENKEDSVSKGLVITIIVVVVICMLMSFCIIAFVKHRKKSGQQNFGHMNGRNQRSKKKKKGETDAWAGPVNLEGGQNADCEDAVEAGQGDDRKLDGTDAVLSTFAALEANGGVGRPGSMEVQKWEEQEPLLFIDEDLKGEGKDKQKEGAEKAKGQKGEEEDANKNTEMKEPNLNGGETFCLTTAV